MSYQVKSTPFLQRIVAKSKKSGELLKLKEEYERIMEINEKAIEKKMREVRLKRLFKEIAEIKEADINRRRKVQQVRPITKNSSNLQKAKEIGQYYSVRNAMGGETDTDVKAGNSNVIPFKVYTLNKNQWREQQREKLEYMRTQVNKRKNYGNQISNWNMQKMLMGKLREEVNEGMKKTLPWRRWNGQDSQTTSESSFDGKEKLLNRINYGNAISNKNRKLIMKNKRKFMKDNSKLLPKYHDSDDATAVVTALSNTNTLRGITSYESCINMHDNIVLDNGLIQPICNTKVLERSLQALRLWQKLSLILKICSNRRNANAIPCSLNENSSSLQSKEPSSKDLPKSIDSPQITTPHNSMVASNLINTLNLGLKPILKKNSTATLNKDQKIKNLIQSYKPHSMDVVKREVLDSTFHTLRNVFEHKND
ncbi:uncharacterized protein LOC142230469 [Haematobia irritans]|uniref:uncharacterized protein LOC142230469 n=1 Tax=Haematobia irritans TaxID=7368 RepID=UPI003F506F68